MRKLGIIQSGALNMIPSGPHGAYKQSNPVNISAQIKDFQESKWRVAKAQADHRERIEREALIEKATPFVIGGVCLGLGVFLGRKKNKKRK